MSHRKSHRHRKSHSSRRHNRSRRNRGSRMMSSAVVRNSVGMVKSTSRRYMPKVKSGLENVGSNVITKGEKTVPYLQRMTRKMFESFGKKR